ncbi:MAG: hypothetical protein E7124_03040 [Bacteroidales bacterium]|nr:hypothetical protein [Bacteroidales bacterium]
MSIVYSKCAREVSQFLSICEGFT